MLEYKLVYPEGTPIHGLYRWDKLLHSIARIGSKMLGIKYTAFEICPESTNLPIESRPIHAISDGLASSKTHELTFASGFSFDAQDYRFGGWSGFDIDHQGKIIAISDEGFALKAEPKLNNIGEIIGFENPIFTSIKGQDGNPLRGKMFTDAEDITILTNGQVAVSFERDHRILVFNDILEPAVESIPLPADMLDAFAQFEKAFQETGNRQYGNIGLEAIAVVNGYLMTVIEETLPNEAEHRVYMQNEMGGWDNLYYQGIPDYGISSATTLPNGNVLFLERSTAYSWGYEHYNCRITELNKNDFFAGNHISGKTLVQFDSKTADNFESIFTYTTQDGEHYVGITTDDNYAWSQRNLFLNFKWNDQSGIALNDLNTQNISPEFESLPPQFITNNTSSDIEQVVTHLDVLQALPSLFNQLGEIIN